ncbi:unnamed protein product [Heterobilharzia americana]|nr:unnamed protein product [Heterobilharzia americana]
MILVGLKRPIGNTFASRISGNYILARYSQGHYRFLHTLYLSAEHERPETESAVLVKARFKNKQQNLLEDVSLSSNLPERFRVFVQTWGCAHNTSDSEYMTGLLAKYGYQVTLGGSQNTNGCQTDDSIDFNNSIATSGSTCNECQNTNDQCCSQQNSIDKPKTINSDFEAKKKAHVWVLNSCTVKGPAEDHFRNAVLEGIKLGKRVVAAGCVPQSRPGADYLKGVSVIGVHQIDRIVEVVEEALQGNVVRFLDKKWISSSSSQLINSTKDDIVISAGAALDLPKIRRNPLIEILAISTGCLNACTYCKTKQARGVLASYPIEQLLDRAKQAFKEGVKELWLTSEDLGAYGRDLDRINSSLVCPTLSKKWPHFITLADLLAGLVPLIPSGCMLRLGMTNPPYILDHIFVYSYSCTVWFRRCIDAMKREYTVEEFSYVVDYLKENVKPPSLPPSVSNNDMPNGCGRITIATDIICGFPNETDDDFNQTVELIENTNFLYFILINSLHVLVHLLLICLEKRIQLSYQTYNGRVGCEVHALITEPSFDGKFWVGHTKAYEQILLPKDPNVYGRIVLVRIEECDKFFMRGIIINPGPFDSIVFPNNEWSGLTLKSSLRNNGKLAIYTSYMALLILGLCVAMKLTDSSRYEFFSLFK